MKTRIGGRAGLTSLTGIQRKITPNGRIPTFHRNPPNPEIEPGRRVPPGQGRAHGHKMKRVYLELLARFSGGLGCVIVVCLIRHCPVRRVVGETK